MSKRPILLALCSAVLFGLSTPLSKILLRDIQPIVLAGLLYAGASLGIGFYWAVSMLLGRKRHGRPSPMRNKDWLWLAAATVSGGILGPICLLFGLKQISGYTASLLLNLEGLATALIAVAFFKEHAGRRVWTALACMTAAGIVLSWDPARGRFSVTGSLLVLAAMAAWGMDNNFTRNIADKDPALIARLKGLIAGAFSLSFGALLGQKIPLDRSLGFGLLLGALSYGASLVFYIKALSGLGAFRAGSFFSIAPFIGVLGSLVVLPEPAKWTLVPGAIFMIAGVIFIIMEQHAHVHRHVAVVHSHPHRHDDEHHGHDHVEGPAAEPHTHEHEHDAVDHAHVHWPDIHHRHGHF